ncbi:hypothetical protein [Streptomyces sp. B3I8]|uniref:MoaF-related domain-containing protein n=1 Tax=Streptomyces sp. B3I8 TaxID=3042303 RepID=UPI00278AB708|nr:hypothetical protein [Streptomyces sp. B3I8]MDQ0786144.1 hypothetical protein [Streptomyces sp. B3I8]
MSAPACAGKAFRFTVDNGTVFHNTYGPDGTELRHETVAGPGTGTAEDVGPHAAEAATGVFPAGWTEKSGMGVTHAVNADSDTVHAFRTYGTPDGRVGELDTGTLEEL